MLQKINDWKCTDIKPFSCCLKVMGISIHSLLPERPANHPQWSASLVTDQEGFIMRYFIVFTGYPKNVRVPLKCVSFDSPLRDPSVGTRDYSVLIRCPWNTTQGYPLCFVWSNEIIFNRGFLFARQLIILESPLPSSHVVLVTVFISNGGIGLRRNDLWTHPFCSHCWIWNLQLT